MASQQNSEFSSATQLIKTAIHHFKLNYSSPASLINNKTKSAALALLITPLVGHAELIPEDLVSMSLDELSQLDVIVTSVNKKPEPLSKTAAAIHVITHHDIRKSGVTTIPDALRMAPGIQVAQIDQNKWSVTARGFSGRFANKLLVMIDGRTVYNPFFTGVFWEMQNAQIDNIDRIEVVRGPAAALWGANAVNGVINIITKPSDKTQGGVVSAAVGNMLKQGFMRYGGRIADQAHYRLYADYQYHDDGIDDFGQDTSDHWDQGQGGARIDWQPNQQNKFTLQGDYSKGNSRHTDTPPPGAIPPVADLKDVQVKFSGGNLIADWTHQQDPDNTFYLKMYYDHFERKDRSIKQIYQTFDMELRHRSLPVQNYEINWGLGYRLIADSVYGKAGLTLVPPERSTQVFSGFIQNELTFIPDQLKAIIAMRLEHNDYTGLEFQPTARLMWTPNQNHSFWASFSRAVQAPSRNTSDIRLNLKSIPGTPPVLVALVGNSEANSEEVFAYETGYRFQFSDKFSLDLAAFYNIYDELRTIEPGTPILELDQQPVRILAPQNVDNKLEGETYGFEAALFWKAHDKVKFHAAYTYTKLNLHYKDNSLDTIYEAAEGETPQQQASLRTDLTLSEQINTHLWLRYVDSLPAQQIPDYITLDARISWQAHQSLEISVTGQNLLDGRHPEYKPELIGLTTSQVERSILGKIEWRF